MAVGMMMKKNSNNDDWAGFKDKLERLKAAVDPRYLINALGFDVSSESGKEIRGACRIHGGDNETSFRFNKDRKSWVCFSHRCHETWGNDIVGLIRAVFNYSFIEAVDYLKQFVGDVDDSYIEYKRKKEMDAFIESSVQSEITERIVNESDLKNFKPFRSGYFITKGYSVETLDFFEIAGGYTDSYKNLRDIIPIRNDEGKLVAYALRNIIDEVDDYRKYIFTRGFQGERTLYNLYNAKEYGTTKPLIIVEGQKSVWRLHEYGIKNVVASFGAYLSNGQMNLLYKYALNGIVVFYDNDAAGVQGIVKACNELRGKLDTDAVFITEVDENGKGLDPSDLDKETIYNYLKGYF